MPRKRRKLPKWAVKFAESDRYMPKDFIPHNAEDAWEEASDLLKTEGFNLGVKGDYRVPKKLRKFTRMSTTFGVPNAEAILFSKDFPSYPGYKKAEVGWHELGHVDQLNGMWPWLFNARYLFSQVWRWAIEVQCYRISVRVLKILKGEKAAVKKARDVARSIASSYKLSRLDDADVRETTERILLSEAL